jgi:hypothetical protein
MLRPTDRSAPIMVCFAVASAFILAAASGASGRTDGGFSPEKTSFALRVRDLVVPYRLFAVSAMPEEIVPLEVLGSGDLASGGKERYVLEPSREGITRKGPGRWQWQVPKEAGLYPIRILDTVAADTITLNLFVMVPYDQLEGEYLNGYRIGRYPAIPLKRLPIYKPPRGFIEVTEENAETYVAPHFRLSQFLCKQDGDYPRYVVLKGKLLLKLELILERVNERGYPCATLHIMSGYRTPYYNRVIGNVKYSRHLYGGAADIFIDEDPRDDMMDDLNKDGKIDYRDAAVLYGIIDRMYGRSWYEPFVGGLARYKKTASHGPFVHVDVRGFHARWGD